MLLVPKASGLLLLFLGTLVLVGWYAGLPALTHLVPGWATMKANTAGCFLLSGLVLLRAAGKRGKVHTDPISVLLLAAVVLIAAASLWEYRLGGRFGLDEFLIRDLESRRLGQPAGRMSPATALSFLFLSVGLFLVDASGLSCLLCLAGMAVSCLALVGLIYKTESLYAVPPFATFALHTAWGFLLLGLGSLTLRRRQGVIPLLRSSYAETARTRPLLAGALLLPPGFGLLCLAGQRRGWYPAEFTVSLVTVLLMLASSWLLWWTSRTGEQIDRRRRDVERELQARTQELAQSNAALEQYAFAAAHDLQEPLRLIAIYSQRLGRAYQQQFGPDEHQYLRILHSSAQRMSQLVADLLLHSRILAQQEQVFTAVNMNGVLQEVMTRLSVPIVESGARVTVEELPTVSGDFDQLVHLFQILLDNALKYRNANKVPQVHVSVQAEGRNWVFAVRDNGMGFDMQYAQQIFGVFKRLHGQEIPGTGMGLAIGKRVAENQGGRLWVESQPETGSIFYIALRRASGSAEG